jgi:hypothetical protein
MVRILKMEEHPLKLLRSPKVTSLGRARRKETGKIGKNKF